MGRGKTEKEKDSMEEKNGIAGTATRKTEQSVFCYNHVWLLLWWLFKNELWEKWDWNEEKIPYGTNIICVCVDADADGSSRITR